LNRIHGSSQPRESLAAIENNSWRNTRLSTMLSPSRKPPGVIGGSTGDSIPVKVSPHMASSSAYIMGLREAQLGT
jgi:hypothetical protein